MNLENLTLKELQEVIKEAERLIRKKEFEARQIREEVSRKKLSIGDIVTVTGDRFKGEIWEVLKLNPKKVQCKRENGETWNIPYAHIIMA